MAESTTNSSLMEPKSLHPLHQIAATPSHKLLLKQWLKEEELLLNRVSQKESQIDSIRKEITLLYLLFFLFHSISLLLLFNSASRDPIGPQSACRRSWIPSICAVLCSLGIFWGIRYKSDCESQMEKLLEREKEDLKLLAKCVEELKKKGVEFDLLKEVDALRRAKSMRVDSSKGAIRKWNAKDFVTLFFFGVLCLVLGLMRMILCS